MRGRASIMRFMCKKHCTAVMAATLGVYSAGAEAQLAQNLLIGSPKALSLGNAVTADPPGIDSIHFNPAGLSRLKGTQTQVKLITADVSITGEFLSNPAYECLFVESSPENGCPDKDFAPFSPDPYRNTDSTVEDFAIYLPGSGITPIPFIAAPLGGVSYQPPDSKLSFGTAVYAPLILGFVRDDNDSGKFYGQELGLTRLTYFSPTVSWQYSDTLAFGFGVGFSYFGVGLKLDYRAPSAITGAVNGLQSGQCNVTPDINVCSEDAGFNPFEKVFTLEADVNEPFSPTVNFGVLWEPNAWLTLGAVYQTESSDRLEGDLTVDIAQNITNFLFAAADDLPFVSDNTISSLTGITRENNGRLERTGYIDVTMPQHLAIGASVQVSPRWKFNLDWKWTETSAWDNLAFYFDEPLPILSTLSPIVGVDQNAIVIPRGYEDSSNFAYGVEYQFSDQIAFRAGYEPRDSGIPDDKRDFLIPLGDSKLYGLGASWTPDAFHVYEVAFGYTKVDEFVPAGTSTNGNDTRTDNFVYNPSAGMDVGYMLEAYLVEFSYHTRY